MSTQAQKDIPILIVPNIANNKTAKSRLTGLSSLSKLLPNPDKILAKAGLDQESLSDLLSDGKVSAAIKGFTSGITSMEFELVQGNCPNDAYEVFFSVFDALPVRQHMEEMLTAFQYGYAFIEVNYIVKNTMILPESMTLKPHKWFGFTEEGKPLFRSKANPNGEDITSSKFIICRNQPTATNPYGVGNLSLCLWPVNIKKTLIEFWLSGSERFGQPWVTVTYDENRFPQGEKLDGLISTIAGQYQDGVLILPQGVTVGVAQTGFSGSSAIYREGIEYFDSIISQIWLGHNGTMESTPGRLGNDHTAVEVRQDIVDSGKYLVEAGFNDLVYIINDLNFWLPKDQLPYVQLKVRQAFDPQTLARDTTLLQAHKLEFTKEHYIKTYQLEEGSFSMPKTETANELLSTVGGANAIQATISLYNQGGIKRDEAIALMQTVFGMSLDNAVALFNEGASPVVSASDEEFIEDGPEEFADIPTNVQDAIDAITSLSMNAEEIEGITSEMLAGFIKKIEEAKSEEELNALFSSQGFSSVDTSKLEDTLTRAYFISMLTGMISEEPNED